MMTLLSQYLDGIRQNLRLDFTVEREVISELQAHIEDKLEEMKAAGLSEEEAASTCVRLLGSAKLVARQIYEVHSQGTWKQALLASLPHLLFALVFALNWWQNIGWLAVALGLIVITVIYGWRQGQPAWLFSWLSYSLLPVIAAGLVLLYLPEGWVWLAGLLYISLALWLICSVTVQAIRKDWIYTALMLLPVPIIIGWFLAVEQAVSSPELSLEDMRHFAPWIGLSFLALAATVATFIRLKRRRHRIGLLFVSGLATLVLVATCAGGGLGVLPLLLLTALMLVLLLSPALLECWLRYSKRQSLA